MKRLDPTKTALVVVDVQERLAGAMPQDQLDGVIRATRILAEGARLLGAPVLVTEQYPRGLGKTLPEVAASLAANDAKRFEKVAFSACDAEGFDDALKATRAEAAVVVGMESHVCVFQTVRDLVDRGLDVHVPIDGVCSRRLDHRDTGLDLCARAGATKTTAESVAFDWLKRAGSDEFKSLSKMIR